MKNLLAYLSHLALTILSGCAHVVSMPSVPVALYEKVAEAFVMVTREDEAENILCTGCGMNRQRRCDYGMCAVVISRNAQDAKIGTTALFACAVIIMRQAIYSTPPTTSAR